MIEKIEIFPELSLIDLNQSWPALAQIDRDFKNLGSIFNIEEINSN